MNGICARCHTAIRPRKRLVKFVTVGKKKYHEVMEDKIVVLTGV